MNLCFTFESRNCVNLFRTPIGLKTCSGLTCTDGVQFRKKFPKISHCGSRSPKYIELSHFTLLFRRGRQRNVQRFKCTCTAIVFLIKPFVWRRFTRRSRHGLLKLPSVLPRLRASIKWVDYSSLFFVFFPPAIFQTSTIFLDDSSTDKHCYTNNERHIIVPYKISEILCTFTLVDRCSEMRVCKHSCDVLLN